MVRTEYLSDHMVFADTVAGWLYGEFFDGVRHGFSYDDVKAIVYDCHKDKLPIRLVAIADNQCVGTVSIVHNDLKSRSYTPWLASLYVDEAFRKSKIGVQLIDRVKEIVKDLGYKELYLRTEFASGYYRKLEWQFVETCDDDFSLKPDVFKSTL